MELESASAYLNCAICMCAAENAVETSCCHSVFCEGCLDEVKGRGDTCPTCRNTPLQYNPSILARRMLGGQPVTCPYSCGEKTTRGELERHKALCKNRPVKL
mmetsp:Transcript_48827/g.126479  ORF Transcript_48827/g.126479 Transcript_48827/m.126479 type:complete len:102 (+) Transcript_48827:154-459(+)